MKCLDSVFIVFIYAFWYAVFQVSFLESLRIKRLQFLLQEKLLKWKLSHKFAQFSTYLPPLNLLEITRGSQLEVFLGKEVLKICSKFTGKHSRRSAISIKLLYNFIEITLRDGCSPVNLLHIFRTLFLKNTSGWLLLDNSNCHE